MKASPEQKLPMPTLGSSGPVLASGNNLGQLRHVCEQCLIRKCKCGSLKLSVHHTPPKGLLGGRERVSAELTPPPTPQSPSAILLQGWPLG